jgi:hypothetical protein
MRLGLPGRPLNRDIKHGYQCMPLAASDLEKPRTPAQLRAFVEKVRASVRANRADFELGMAKQDYYKEFLDEVEPLCYFAEVAYPADHKVQPVLGNQGFDAIVFDAQGREVDKVEFAKPHDGAASAARARQVVARGHSDLHICDYTEVLNEFMPFFEVTGKDKSLKDYSGVTVVFVLAAPPALVGVESVFERQIERLKAIIAENKFKAKRVFLYVPHGQLHRIDG